MAFVPTADEKLLSMPASKAKELVAKEIEGLIKARGFEPGSYVFVPASNTSREDGTIINGNVTGHFTTKEPKSIVIERADMSDDAWRRLLVKFNTAYRYINVNDIKQITLTLESAKFHVDIETPKNKKGYDYTGGIRGI